MKLPFEKNTMSAAIERATGDLPHLPKVVVVSQPAAQKICKRGPFDLPKVTPEYPYFSQLLKGLVKQIKGLPDFSDDNKIAVMSDFGGEHPTAHFYTYSFLFLAYNKVGPFAKQVQELREKFGLLTPYSEFAYKKLKHGPRSRALPEYLRLVDNFIHGAIITVAIDKRIGTVFGSEKQQAHPIMVEQLSKEGFGTWKGHAAEKVSRVCHVLAAFTSLLTTEQQSVLWYSDNDLINDDGTQRTFSDTQQYFGRILGMYMNHRLDVLGFGKSFTDKSHLDDLLSVPDFAAGVTQELLQSHKTGEGDIAEDSEKAAVMRWIASPSRFLTKITLQIGLDDDGSINMGLVDITPIS